MGSRGSVIPHFLNIRNKNSLPITDEHMTRFNITLDQGVKFVIHCLGKMWGGELFVPKIPSYRITDVAKAIAPHAKFKIIGIRPGEKLHEEMITATDSMNTIEFDTYYAITPNSEYISWDTDKFLLESNDSTGNYCSKGFSYNSGNNDHFLSVNEIKKLIIKNVPNGDILR
jgi:FlaA1/EpsC-like NDP-sugar epimerase